MSNTMPVPPTRHQLDLARSLGCRFDPEGSVEQLVEAVDEALGEQARFEQARWFLRSVWRGMHPEDRQQSADSDLDEHSRQQLAEDLLADHSTRASLIKVLSDPCCRYTLVVFGKSRIPRRHQLADSTLAYRHARELLSAWRERNQADEHSAVRGIAKARQSIVSRRAARRGYQGPAAETGQALATTAPHGADGPATPAMSEQEFAELEQVLGKPGDKTDALGWSWAQLDDRLSLITGLLAGLAVFLVCRWLFF